MSYSIRFKVGHVGANNFKELVKNSEPTLLRLFRDYNIDDYLVLGEHLDLRARNYIPKTDYLQFNRSLFKLIDMEMLKRRGGFVPTSQKKYYSVFAKTDDNLFEVAMIDKFFIDHAAQIEKYFVDRNTELRNKTLPHLILYANGMEALVDNRLLSKAQIDNYLDNDYYYGIITAKRSNDSNEIGVHISTIAFDENEPIDYLVTKFEPIDKILYTKELEKITLIPPESEYHPIPNYDPKKLSFVVYDVGQALMTSIDNENIPIYFFDFGHPMWNNAHTLVSNTPILIYGKPSIFLSHLHYDHYSAANHNPQAFSLDWYIPNLPISEIPVRFNHHSAKIQVNGGAIFRITKPLSCGLFTINLSNSLSNIDPLRQASTDHEKGMYFEIITGKRILVCGDQDYDYMTISNLYDVLVATHHGGKYSWKSTSQIPKPTGDGALIVYSYGKNNTHNHPSQTHIYRMNGWVNEWHTVNGSKIISL